MDKNIFDRELENFKENLILASEKRTGDIKNKKLALCLGAGVSRCYVGNWNELLNEIAASEFWKKVQDFSSGVNFSDMSNYLLKHDKHLPDGISTLEKGEYLLIGAVDKDLDWSTEEKNWWREISFAAQTQSAIERILARNIKCKVSEVYDKLPEHFIASVSSAQSNNFNTLEAMIKACLCGKVTTIINYNFDTVLEHLLQSDDVIKFFQNKYRGLSISPKKIEIHSAFHLQENPVKKINENVQSDIIKIYHVHGILDPQVSLKPIIFSQDSYERTQESVLNWSNVQIYSAICEKESEIICIGFSGTDDNFRNICRRFQNDENLRLSKINYTNDQKNEKNIFLIRSLQDVVSAFYSEDKKLILSCKEYICALASIQSYADMIEKYYKQYGIIHLWVKNFSNITGIIDNLLR